MIRRSTWILVVVFLVVLAVAVYWQQRPPASPEGEATPLPQLPALFPVTLEEIAELQVQDSAGESVALEREADGLWRVAQPAGGDTDQDQVESKLAQLTSLRVKTNLEPAADLSIFGLDSPAYRISLSTTTGQAYDLSIGDLTPTADGYYVQMNGNSPQVVNKSSLDTFLGILSTPPFLPPPTPEPEGQPTGTPEADE